ncbi:MAG TPA: alpha-N-acetylglucosaminidase [Pseudonocardiaceae bacterium]
MTRMPNRRTVLKTALGVGVLGTIGLATPAIAAPASFDVDPVRAMITRYLGARAAQFELRALPAAADGLDQFQVSGRRGHVLLAGTSAAALAGAFNWWLKHVANGHISWDYNQLDLPALLPAPPAPVTVGTPYRIRFQGNPTWLGYSSPYWDWDRWQQEIDYFAAAGYNQVTVYIGHELAYYRMLRDQGYTDLEARSWIPLPAHQTWWWFDNISNYTDPIPLDLMQRRAELGLRIIDRIRELGVTAVVPAFLGFVPVDFATRNPGVDVVAQGTWGWFTRPSLLNPTEPLYAKMAADYYGYQKQLFGTAGIGYAGDFLQEGGQVGDIDLTAAATAVQSAMQKANPGALWMLQAWSGNPRKELVAGLDASTVYVLDLQADANPIWPSTNAFWGAPWSWGTISNAGGTISLYGRLPAINTDLPAALANPNRGNLVGLHFAPEGTDTNPVLADFLTDMFWRTESVDLPGWITDYASRRYGADDPQARQAWQLLLATAYGASGNPGNVDTAPDSLFNAVPSLTAASADIYVASTTPYDPAQLQVAWRHLLAADPRLRRVPTYTYDLLDVTRQVLDNAGRTLLPQINAAYQAGDRPRFQALTGRWLDLIQRQDRLLGTDARFLLGVWLADARASANGPAERALLEYDARNIITAWANRATFDSGLHDYANRDWQGLVGDHYHHRWQLYFDGLDTALANGADPAPIDWYAVDDAWCHQQNSYTTTASGDTWTTANQVWDNLTVDPMFLTVTAAANDAVVAAGGSVQVTPTVSNTNPFTPATGVSVALRGFTTGAPVPLPDIAPGATATTEATVTVPADYVANTAMDRISVAATTTFHYGHNATGNTGYAALLVPSPVQPPYRTATFTTSTFGQHEDTFAIYTAGADIWGATNEFGTIYLPGALAVGGSITTQVSAQDPTEQWARAGIVVRNSLASNGSPGYLDLAITPSNGCAFSWDSNGDGELDDIAIAAGFAAPAYLKLTRTGPATYTGHCSADGTNWTTVGSATAPGATGQQDVGLFATAASTTTMGLVRFAGFTVAG